MYCLHVFICCLPLVLHPRGVLAFSSFRRWPFIVEQLAQVQLACSG
jgi:hypothetical protein